MSQSENGNLQDALEVGWELRRRGMSRRLDRWSSLNSGHHQQSPKSDNPVTRILREVKERVLKEVENSRVEGLMEGGEDTIRAQVRKLLEEELQHRRLLNFRERDRRELEKRLMDELTGAGVLQPLLDDPTLSDILINGPDEVWVDRYGRLERTDIRFESNKQLLHIVSRLVEQHGRHLEESTPYVDARLSDGSRLHAVIPPLSEIGPVISIRKSRLVPLTLEEIVGTETLSREMADFIALCVQHRVNILFTGGASTGKTSLLNVFSRFIPLQERVVTIEETRELYLNHGHTVSLETRPPNTEGKGGVDLEILVRNALRMRADRIIVGEVRGREVFEMLQAMNVGHEGSMSTLHANSPKDAVRRLEGLVQLAGHDLPSRTVKEMIHSTIDVIVQLKRSPDGSRRVVSIAEVGNDDNAGGLFELFRYDSQKGFLAVAEAVRFCDHLSPVEEEVIRIFANARDRSEQMSHREVPPIENSHTE